MACVALVQSAVHEIPYHCVLKGRDIFENLETGTTRDLVGGEIVLLPRGSAHVPHDDSGHAPGLTYNRQGAAGWLLSENDGQGEHLAPFPVEHQRLVKDVMVNEAGPDWILCAKTGWTGKIGWWVGWVEWPSGPVFFALNMDTPNRLGDLAKRQSITRSVLRSINALPKAP